MMKAILTLFGVILVLTVIAACFYGCYLAIDYIWSLYMELDSVIRLILLSSMAAIVFGCLIIAGAIKTAVQKSNKGRLMEAKFQLYKSLVELYKPFFASPQQPLQQMYSEVLAGLAEIESEMQILSAGAVLEIYGKLECAMRDSEGWDRVNNIFQSLIKSIRRDLGYAPNYNESKLSYLVPSTRVENSDRPSPGVSL